VLPLKATRSVLSVSRGLSPRYHIASRGTLIVRTESQCGRTAPGRCFGRVLFWTAVAVARELTGSVWVKGQIS
jgi:hypothetical protein